MCKLPYLCMELVVLLPLLDLGLGQSLDVLGGVDGSLAANAVDEVQALGSLEQGFLITGRIAELTESALANQLRSLGIILGMGKKERGWRIFNIITYFTAQLLLAASIFFVRSFEIFGK